VFTFTNLITNQDGQRYKYYLAAHGRVKFAACGIINPTPQPLHYHSNASKFTPG